MPIRKGELVSEVSSFTVLLNFHGDLAFFLKSKVSNKIVERRLGEKTSVKDVIESCGVPHPEIDLILVDGQPVGFSHILECDQEIDVYPIRSLPTLFHENRLQPAGIKQFIADGHLGKLARDLRLLGFDVAYDRDAQDRQLLAVMNIENRAEKVEKADVIEKLEPLTRIHYEHFRRCTGCRQIYWPGSHFDKLRARIEGIRATLAAKSRSENQR